MNKNSINRNTRKLANENRKNSFVRIADSILKGCLGLVLIILLSGVLIFSYDLVTKCSYFFVKKITIQGNKHLTKTEILNWIPIRKTDNILGMNIKHVREKLLFHPWISNANVKRKSPFEIMIQIEEHHPIALLQMDRTYLMNNKGYIFKEQTNLDPQNLPVVSGLRYSDLALPGIPPKVVYTSVIDILRIGQSSSGTISLNKMNRIHVDAEIGVTVFPKNGIKRIIFGYNDYRNKLDRLEKIVAYLKSTKSKLAHIEMIDLNHRDSVVVRPSLESTPNDRKEVKNANPRRYHSWS